MSVDQSHLIGPIAWLLLTSLGHPTTQLTFLFKIYKMYIIQFNSIQVYLYSAFYDTIAAKRFTGN